MVHSFIVDQHVSIIFHYLETELFLLVNTHNKPSLFGFCNSGPVDLPVDYISLVTANCLAEEVVGL